jgi:hypothetical protein
MDDVPPGVRVLVCLQAPGGDVVERDAARIPGNVAATSSAASPPLEPDDPDALRIDAWVATQVVQGRREVLARHVLQDARKSGHPVVGQRESDVPLLGEECGVTLVQSSLGAAECEDTGERGCGLVGGLGVEQDAHESAVAYFGANQ